MSEIYLGNPNLKKANTSIEFTQEQVEEFIKCKQNPVYFTKNYVKIVTLDAGLQPFIIIFLLFLTINTTLLKKTLPKILNSLNLGLVVLSQ